MDGWNTSFLLGWPIFRGYVSFREGNINPDVFFKQSQIRKPVRVTVSLFLRSSIQNMLRDESDMSGMLMMMKMSLMMMMMMMMKNKKKMMMMMMMMFRR